MTTDERLKLAAEAERLSAAATTGPWLNAGYDPKRGQEVVHGKHKFPVCQVYGVALAFLKSGGGSMSTDAAFIARSRTLVPALAAALREAEAEIERLKILIRRNCDPMDATLEDGAAIYKILQEEEPPCT